MASPDAQLATMLANLPDKTGKALPEWKTIIAAQNLSKHGLIVKFLKSEYKVTHGFANLIAAKTLERDEEIDWVAAQYSGAKADLKPIYEALLSYAVSLGADVDVAPKKTSVSLRRKKQFALITPATKTRIDLGLALKGEAAGERLETYNAMCSHRIRIESLEELDGFVRNKMRLAYDRSG